MLLLALSPCLIAFCYLALVSGPRYTDRAQILALATALLAIPALYLAVDGAFLSANVTDAADTARRGGIMLLFALPIGALSVGALVPRLRRPERLTFGMTPQSIRKRRVLAAISLAAPGALVVALALVLETLSRNGGAAF